MNKSISLNSSPVWIECECQQTLSSPFVWLLRLWLKSKISFQQMCMKMELLALRFVGKNGLIYPKKQKRIEFRWSLMLNSRFLQNDCRIPWSIHTNHELKIINSNCISIKIFNHEIFWSWKEVVSVWNKFNNSNCILIEMKWNCYSFEYIVSK